MPPRPLGTLLTALAVLAGLFPPRVTPGYDFRGNLVSIRDPLFGHAAADPGGDRETTLTHDERGNRLTRTLPGHAPGETLTERFEYDDRGRQVLHTSFEGVVAESLYDDGVGAGGRMTGRRLYADRAAFDAGQVGEEWSYVFDARGRQVAATQTVTATGETRTVTTAYDDLGRVVRVSSPEGVLHHGYDDLGRRVRVFTTDGAGNVVTDVRYDHDVHGRLAAVRVVEKNDAPAAETTAYEYDLHGGLDLLRHANGTVADHDHDARGRLVSLTHLRPDATPADLSDNPLLARYEYDLRADGRRAAADETLVVDRDGDGTAETETARYEWTYDAANRLTDELFSTDVAGLSYDDSFAYDLTGNRVRYERDFDLDGSPEEVTDYLFDAGDRMRSSATAVAAGPDRSATYAYDGTQQTGRESRTAGVLTGTATFAYDLRGRNAESVVTTHDAAGAATGSERTRYAYDAAGLRVATETATAGADGAYGGTVTTRFLNDPSNPTGYGQVLEETTTDAAGAETKKVVYTVGRDVLGQTVYEQGQPAVTHVLHADGHGSTRVLTDAAGAVARAAGVAQAFAFTAYGEAVGFSEAAAATALLYSGERTDACTGRQYLRARYYDPAAGTFNRLDPYFGNTADPQSLHKYLYVHGDPVTGYDPTGMFFGVAGIGVASTIRLQVTGAYGGAAMGVGAARGAFGSGDSVAQVSFNFLLDALLDPIDGVAQTSASWLNLLDSVIQRVYFYFTDPSRDVPPPAAAGTQTHTAAVGAPFLLGDRAFMWYSQKRNNAAKAIFKKAEELTGSKRPGSRELHHLNMYDAFRTPDGKLIFEGYNDRKGKGGMVVLDLEGGASDLNSEHGIVHRRLGEFWQPYRQGGERAGQGWSVGDYNRVLADALIEIGRDRGDVQRAMVLVKAEQADVGLSSHSMILSDPPSPRKKILRPRIR